MSNSSQENQEKTETPQSKGGTARAEVLTPNERRSIARRAAMARWERVTSTGDPSRIATALHRGRLPIGDAKIQCYVLDDPDRPNKRRVIHKRAMAKALGLKSSGGNAFMKTLSGQKIRSALGEELRAKIENPLVFKGLREDPVHGYEATVLIEVCLALMDAHKRGELASSQEFLARQAEIIVRASAKLGINALVDEATGYIADKRKGEYLELFKQFIREEFAQWEKQFPDQFFDLLYRLYGLKRRNPKSMQHPKFFGRVIRKYIYYPLASSNGAILHKLDEKNPVVYSKGGRRYKLFQFLSDHVGLPAFKAHLWQVIGIGMGSTDKGSFDRSFARAFPPDNFAPQFLDDELN